METILEVDNLKISFKTQLGRITPLDGVSFSLSKGETLGIVGESGCGKTITAFSIMRLLPKNAFLGEDARIAFRGKDILSLGKEELQKIRGKSISMVFQEPMTSLNPLYTIGWQISEVYRLHEGLSEEEAMTRSVEMLRLVGIPEPKKRVTEFPHQLSGGMRQRVMIAMAL
ncbi:MAG TPA: peptide ABC transporter ATP-binding protein, partial [Mesotoga infera]|nr:peptide ABC transporter ATP-binding protein [Mesotoga infera]